MSWAPLFCFLQLFRGISKENLEIEKSRNFLFFFKFYFIFKLYIIVLVLPNIKMNFLKKQEKTRLCEEREIKIVDRKQVT